MDATVWSDYICPWAYLGRDRTALLRSLGVSVRSQPFELHPELPLAGRPVRPGGRIDRVHADIAQLCAEVGLPFTPPALVPNSRRALVTAEVVRQQQPDAFAAVDDALFRAHFVEQRDIGDADVLDEIVLASGADAVAIRNAVERGDGGEAVAQSMAAALEHGIAATPAWLFDGGLVVPGAQPRALFERIVARLRTRSG